MTNTDLTLTGGRKPLSEIMRPLGYRDVRSAQQFLDQHGVPYVTIRRVRHYRPGDVPAALDRAATLLSQKKTT